MVYTANDLLNWKDFPKGLRVLLLLDQEDEEEDTDSASKIRSKLEEMDYIVTTFFNEDEAFSAISNQSTEIFHVAIVEVTVSNSHGRLKFLEVAKDLPTIMTSRSHCLNTMMKCIALGAVEFLQKPLSEDKLRNIWQHVAHKAFNAGKEETAPESEVRLRLLEDSDQTTQLEPTPSTTAKEDKYPAPSTPQLKQTGPFLDDGDYHDQTHEKEIESKSVDTNMTVTETEQKTTDDHTLKEEGEPPDGLGGDQEPDKTAPCPPPLPRSNKMSRKKTKIDWTSELHKKFVKAVEQLGVDQAIPSRILEIMRVEGLTRHNIASHLQKYRMHRRHILPKDDINTRKWHHHHHNYKDPSSSFQRNHQSVKPVVAYPLYHPHSIYHHPNWVGHNGYPANTAVAAPTWGSPAGGYYHPPPPWQHQPPPYTGVHADAWGCPIGQTSHGQYPGFPQNGMGFRGCYIAPRKVVDFFPTDEIIDEVMEEAINKPWLPLPIGLNPPSTESVLLELSKQGISGVAAPPQQIKRHRS